MKRGIVFCITIIAIAGAIFYFHYSDTNKVHETSALHIQIPARTSAITLGSQPSVAIVQHHLVAAQLMNETLARVAAYSKEHHKSIRRIVLLAPNHFELGAAPVVTSRASWETQDGIVAADTELIDKTIQSGFAQDDFFVAGHDHGVYNVLPFIKRLFPDARVMPLLMKYYVTQDQASRLAEFLNTQLGPDDLVVVSADFTHYMSESVMSVHDSGSIRALQNIDETYARGVMDVDTPASIVAAMRFAALRGAEQFVLTERSSSALLLGRNEPPDTTSYISGVYIQGKKIQVNSDVQTILYIPAQAADAHGLKPLVHGFMSVVKVSRNAPLGNKLFTGENIAVGEIRESGRSTYFVYPIEKISPSDWQLVAYPKNRTQLHEFVMRMHASRAQRDAIESERGLSL